MGGLLGAFELSQDAMFLDKAQECVDLMLPVFATSPSGEGHVAVVQPLHFGSPQMFCCPNFS